MNTLMPEAKLPVSSHHSAAMQPGPAAPVHPTCLAVDSLYVIGATVPVDSRISWYAKEHHGRHLPFNTYVLKDGEETLLLESGVPAIFDSLASQLRGLLGGQTVHRIAVTRNEPDCVANLPHWVRDFGLTTVHSPGLMNTLQFFPSDAPALETVFDHRSTELQMLSFGIRCAPALPGGTIPVSATRELEVLAVPLKVLPTAWYYDRSTRTMFCSDSFSDETSVYENARMIRSADPHDVLVRRARRHFEGKFNWLARSDLTSVIADLEKIFANYEIDILAPNRGLLIHGRLAVEAKIEALLIALKAL